MTFIIKRNHSKLYYAGTIGTTLAWTDNVEKALQLDQAAIGQVLQTLGADAKRCELRVVPEAAGAK